MAKKGYILNEKDLEILKGIARDSRNKRVNTSNRPGIPLDQSPATGIYVVLTPDGGIPALNLASAAPGEGDEPGYAECQIYQIIVSGSIPTLYEVTPVAPIRVYNLSGEDVSGGEWALVHRDKYGNWFISTGGAGSSLSWLRITNETKGTYGWEALLQQWNSDTMEWEDVGSETGTGSPPDIVWLQPSDKFYVPNIDNVFYQTVYLCRKENNAPDGRALYVAYVHIDLVAWVKITSTTKGLFGYPGQVVKYDSVTQDFNDVDFPGETGTGQDIWVDFSKAGGGYAPRQSDVDEPVYYLARFESIDVADDRPIYLAMGGLTIDVICQGDDTGTTTDEKTFGWYAGRLIYIDSAGTGSDYGTAQD